jgi:hypothetical protein
VTQETKVKHNSEALKKICPHCGQQLQDSAFKCSQCKKWVPNELFNKLCDEDVNLIKNNDLNMAAPPSLIVLLFRTYLKDGNLDETLLKTLGRKLTKHEQFNYFVFQSYCYFVAACSFAHMKKGFTVSGLSSKQVIENELIIAFLNMAIYFYLKEPQLEDKESADKLRAEGWALFDKFDDIWERLGTDVASQTNATIALASTVFEGTIANMYNGLPLYTLFIDLPFQLQDACSKMFLVEEKDFDWQALIQPK